MSSCVLRDDGAAMQGLFAKNIIPKGTVIDQYWGMLVAFTEEDMPE
jgi:hypothetical protein